MAKSPRFCAECGGPLTSRHDGERDRPTCGACGWVAYLNPTPVVAAIVVDGDDVILARSAGWPEGMYGLVTGFLEQGEHPDEAVLREVREELCVEAAVESFVGLYSFEPMNQLLIAYHVRVVDGVPSAGPELAGIKRVPVHRLRPWPMGTGEAVRDWIARRPTPEGA